MKTVLVWLLQAYRYAISPWLGNRCRYYPSCSAYSIEALHKHGVLKGLKIGIWRVLRCHPWCDGGHDPVP